MEHPSFFEPMVCLDSEEALFWLSPEVQANISDEQLEDAVKEVTSLMRSPATHMECVVWTMLEEVCRQQLGFHTTVGEEPKDATLASTTGTDSHHPHDG